MHSGIQIDGTASVYVEEVKNPKIIDQGEYYNVIFMQDDTMSHRVQMNRETLLTLFGAIKPHML